MFLATRLNYLTTINKIPLKEVAYIQAFKLYGTPGIPAVLFTCHNQQKGCFQAPEIYGRYLVHNANRYFKQNSATHFWNCQY